MQSRAHSRSKSCCASEMTDLLFRLSSMNPTGIARLGFRIIKSGRPRGEPWLAVGVLVGYGGHKRVRQAKQAPVLDYSGLNGAFVGVWSTFMPPLRTEWAWRSARPMAFTS